MEPEESTSKRSPYKTLAILLVVHLFVMFALTYSGVYKFEHIYPNWNRFYMAVLMVMPMIMLMVFFMRQMYENKKLNLLLYGASAAMFVITFFALRTQAFVGDKQFLKSMIPHHSIAIKNCEEGNFTDPEISKLCVEIVEAQRAEISQMEDILKRLNQ